MRLSFLTANGGCDGDYWVPEKRGTLAIVVFVREKLSALCVSGVFDPKNTKKKLSK